MSNALYEIVKKKLEENSYKLTLQRELTLDILIENTSKHLTTEEIHHLVRKKNPDIGLATVYRTLQLFNDLDIIHKLNFGDGCYRYEINRQQKHHHHHLICVICGAIYEFGDDLLERLEENIERENSFKVIDHRVKFFGHCYKCRDTVN